MSVGPEKRKAREKHFHDGAFATGKRRSVWKFYAQTDSIREEFRRTVLARSPRRILEIGCGLGTFTLSLARKGVKVSAIDISEYAVRTARKKANAAHVNIDFAVMDVENTQYDDDEFDVVCGVSILHHLNLYKAIPEIRRVLRKEGKAIFIEPMAHNPLISLFRYFTPRLRSRDEQPLRMKDIAYMRSVFDQCEIKHYYLVTLIVFPLRGFPCHNSLKRILEWLDNSLFSVVPGLRKYSWQVLIVLAS